LASQFRGAAFWSRISDLSAEAFFRTQRVILSGVFAEFLDQRSDAVLTAFHRTPLHERMKWFPEIELTIPAGDRFKGS
jgi:hypothetical protein